jgi:hypothetical protein
MLGKDGGQQQQAPRCGDVALFVGRLGDGVGTNGKLQALALA